MYVRRHQHAHYKTTSLKLLLFLCSYYFRHGAVKVRFNLTFRGNLEGLTVDIPSLIDQKTSKRDGADYFALFLKDFLVDVRSKGNTRPTTSRPTIRPTTTTKPINPESKKYKVYMLPITKL